MRHLHSVQILGNQAHKKLKNGTQNTAAVIQTLRASGKNLPRLIQFFAGIITGLARAMKYCQPACFNHRHHSVTFALHAKVWWASARYYYKLSQRFMKLADCFLVSPKCDAIHAKLKPSFSHLHNPVVNIVEHTDSA